jgi:hypothetical protein
LSGAVCYPFERIEQLPGYWWTGQSAVRTTGILKMARFVGLFLALLTFARLGQGQEIGFYATLPQVGTFPVLFLSGNDLRASFATTDLWLVSIHFPATVANPAADLQLQGPVVSVYPPFDGFPGGESISYNGDFLLSESQKQLLLAGQVQLVLTQDLFSTDPSFQPQVVVGALSDVILAPLATPRIVRPENLRLDWQSQVGQAYQMQFRNQVDAPVWSNIDLTIIATSTNMTADVPIVGTARFYRVIHVQ